MTGAGVRVLEQVATRSERAQSVIGEGHDTLQAGRQDIGGQPHPERVVRTDPGREVGERLHAVVAGHGCVPGRSGGDRRRGEPPKCRDGALGIDLVAGGSGESDARGLVSCGDGLEVHGRVGHRRGDARVREGGARGHAPLLVLTDGLES